MRVALVVCVAAGTLALGVLSGDDARAQTPPAVPAITAVASGDTALTVAWTAPTGVTGIESYDVRWIETSASATDKADDANWTVLDPAWETGDLHVIVTGLTNDTSYDMQVRAVTTSDGDWSATSTGTPTEPGSFRVSATAMVNELPVQGVIDPFSDYDYFSFRISGSRDVFIWTTGDTDTYGKLFLSSDSGHTAKNDNGDFADGPLNFALGARLEAGLYFIEISSSTQSAGDDASGPYTLHLRTSDDTSGRDNASPVELGSVTLAVLHDTGTARGCGGGNTDYGDVDYFKLDLTAETTITVRTSGFVSDTVGQILDSAGAAIASNNDAYLVRNLGQFALRETLPAGVSYIKVRPHCDNDSGWYFLHVAESGEPASSKASAAELHMNEAAGGTTDPDGDWFTFTLEESTRVALALSSIAADIEATLEDSAGTVLDVNQREVYPAAPASGIYPSAILDTLAAGTYNLKIDAAQPADTVAYVVLLQRDGGYEWLLGGCPGAPSGIDDELYRCQWHLDSTGQSGTTAGEDINIEDASLGSVWDITKGAGVNVAVVDTGLDYLHEDLVDNVLESGHHSYRDDMGVFDGPLDHGTLVSGIIAARDNGTGMRGVAPRATIYAYNLLGNLNTANMADAMSRGRATTSVSNNSWGPTPGPTPRRVHRTWDMAVEAGLSEGDGGKGVVYVFSGGNGNDMGDWASLNEHTSHYGVTTVCAVNGHGKRSGYSEQGPNLWVCAPSNSPGIGTTRRYSSYTSGFGGTSAAVPMVSGVVALVRAAGPSLTWRDVKLVLATSARRNDAGDAGWEAGALRYGSATDSYSYSHKYGFGVVDASAAVALAGSWANVPEMGTAAASADTSHSIPDTGTAVSSTVRLGGSVDFAEFVEINVDFAAPRFRNLRIELESPQGATSVLTAPNSKNCTAAHPCPLTGVFRFGSARHLGEDPRGVWTLRVADVVAGGGLNSVRSWDLRVYGHRQSVPGAVLLGFVRPGSGSLTVGWDEPDDTGLFGIVGYEVRHVRSDAADKSDSAWAQLSSTCVAGSCSAAITGLTDGVRRDVQVRAVSTRPGAWSSVARGTPGAANGEPFFVDGERTTRGVNEHAGSGVAVGSAVAARDAEPDVFVYSLAGDDAGLFVIDASSGQLTTADGFVSDFEGARNSFDVTVSVSDGKADDGTASTAVDDVIAVTVAVVNVDEPGGVSLSVSQPRAGRSLSAFLSDPDDPDRLIRGTKWRWERSAPGSMLGWARVTGVPLWGWRHSTYVPNDDDVGRFLRVTASYSDPQGPGKSAEVVSALLVRADNVAPMFPAAETGVRNVDESAGPGIGVGLPVVAGDDDGDDLTYSLGGPDAVSFGIVAGSGQLVTEAALDFETKSSYAVTVTATDPRGLTGTRPVTITVDDVDEAPRIVSGPASVEVREEVGEDRPGTVAVFRADDPEGAQVVWELRGDDRDRLGIGRTTGVVEFVMAPDFEAPADADRDNFYAVTVVASDGGLAGTWPLVVEIVNDDDRGSVGLSSLHPRVGTELRATLSDPDGSVSGAVWKWERSQSGSPQDWDVVGGAVSDSYTVVDDDLDRFLQVSVSYRDRHGPHNQQDPLKGASVETASAVLPPVMNMPPVFPEDETGLREVPENTESGEDFGDPVAADDPDPGDRLTYSLGGRDGAAFDVDAGSGQLRTEAPLDHESRSSYVVTVTATDPSGEFAAKRVTVTVTDTDDLGMLELSTTQPEAGKPLTATLVDPDKPLTGLEWTWWRSGDSSGPGDWVQIDGAASSSYQPAAGDPDDGDPDGGGHVGLWLRVRVTYRDIHNPADSADPNVAPSDAKMLQAVTVNPVQAPSNPTRPSGPSGPTNSGNSGSGGGGGGGGGGDLDVGVASFVVANGWSAADVGVASVLAARTSGAVVVYTAGDGLSEETRLLLREAMPAEVTIVGGNAAVSRDVRTQIRAASSESGISRVSGEDRADTAAGTARRILGAPAAAGRITLVVANGWSPPDIGAAAALAARSGRSAVIYTEAARLPEASAAVLRDYQVARVIMVGGTAAISQDTQNAIAGAASGASISRLTGDDRIDTAAQAARRVLGNPAAAPDGVTLVIANGWSAPDVGVAAALAAATDNAAVAYTAQRALPDATAALIRDYRPTQVIIVGGRAAIANDVRTAITQTAPDSAGIRRITGTTRTDTAARAARRILANL